MKLIDADELLKELEPYGLTKGVTIGRHSGMTEMLMGIVEKQPTVDAVPVVKCKDCQYSHEPSVLVKGLVECEKSCSGECLKREDWYCPLGERKSD